MNVFLLAVAAALLAAGGGWYFRAYQEAREWREIHGFWGSGDREQALVMREELVKRGVRVKLKAIGGPDLLRMPRQRFTSVRVHRDDYDQAAAIVVRYGTARRFSALSSGETPTRLLRVNSQSSRGGEP